MFKSNIPFLFLFLIWFAQSCAPTPPPTYQIGGARSQAELTDWSSDPNSPNSYDEYEEQEWEDDSEEDDVYRGIKA